VRPFRPILPPLSPTTVAVILLTGVAAAAALTVGAWTQVVAVAVAAFFVVEGGGLVPVVARQVARERRAREEAEQAKQAALRSAEAARERVRIVEQKVIDYAAQAVRDSKEWDSMHEVTQILEMVPAQESRWSALYDTRSRPTDALTMELMGDLLD